MTIQVAPSPVFKRLDDGNLEVTVPITVTEALRGGTVEVPTLSGTKRIRVKPGTQHGSIQRLKGEGPPRASSKTRGDIRYRLETRGADRPHRRPAAGRRPVGRNDERRATRGLNCCDGPGPAVRPEEVRDEPPGKAAGSK